MVTTRAAKRRVEDDVRDSSGSDGGREIFAQKRTARRRLGDTSPCSSADRALSNEENELEEQQNTRGEGMSTSGPSHGTKRPPRAFIMFKKTVEDEAKKCGKKLTGVEDTKLASARWNQMSDAMKAPFKAQFEKEMATYKEVNPLEEVKKLSGDYYRIETTAELLLDVNNTHMKDVVTSVQE